MPAGWTASFVWIDSEGSTVIFDSDLVGDGAVEVRFVATCDVTGYVQVSSDVTGTRRYELVQDIVGEPHKRRVYLFDGGCTSLDFRFDSTASAALVNEISRAIGFIPRAEIDEMIRSITDGREQLDPPSG
jgi:hypothetical protein